MEEVENLIKIVDRLLGPGGCPWDREQTMKTVRPYILEEACELIEAIDLDENEHIKEELGDLFFHSIFFSRIAEKEGRFHFRQMVQGICEKLIRRHPHVFGEEVIGTSEEVIQNWEHLKMEEKSERKSLLDGIPNTLPALTRANKMAKKMKKGGAIIEAPMEIAFESEEELGRILFGIAAQAESNGIDPENALRYVLAKEEEAFRKAEEKNL